MKFIGSFVVVTSCIVLGVLWGGYVFSILWGWFMVPIFQLPVLTVAQGIGIVLVMTLYIPSQKSEKKDFKEIFCDSILLSIFRPLLALGIGWIVRLFL